MLLGLIMPVFLQAQSGWTRDLKSYFIKLDVSHFNSDRYISPNGTELKTTAFRQTTLGLYGEYGFRKRFTLIANAPLLRLNSFESTEIAAGLGDLRLEAKYRLTSNHFPVSVSVAPEFPTGRANAFAANKTFPADRINLPTGDGEFNVWATLAASKSFGKFYTSAFAAYDFRTKYEGKKFRDLYQFGAEIGYNPWKPLWINTKLRAQYSIGESLYPELSFVRGDATTYTLVSAEILYKINKKWGLSATYLTGGDWIAPVSNLYIAPYFSIGVVFEQ